MARRVEPGLLDPEARLQHALDLAFRRLGRRDHTVREMERHLEQRGLDAETSAEAIERLREMGYLDDARFAVRFAEDRRTLDGWGRERIDQRLAAAGVAAEHREAALAGADAAGELTAALELLERRFPALAPDDPREAQRAYGVLVRKGYDTELAGEAVRAHRRALASVAGSVSGAPRRR